jgi:hypothetical protein
MIRKIITSRVNPPIPTTAYDWSATLDGYEPGDPIGWGATEAGAIRALEAELDDDDGDDDWHDQWERDEFGGR